jgi:hypothetical protein
MFRRFRPASQDAAAPPAPVVETKAWTRAVIAPAVLLMVLGAWVFLAPLVGPYFSFGFDTSTRWRFSQAHWLLSLAPGIALFCAGLLMTRPSRALGWLAGLVAVAAGVWLVIGPTLHPTWSSSGFTALPGTDAKTAARWIADFYGAGALAIYLGAQAQGLLERRVPVQTPVAPRAPLRSVREDDPRTERETVVSGSERGRKRTTRPAPQSPRGGPRRGPVG